MVLGVVLCRASMILAGLFQLKIFHDSMVLLPRQHSTPSQRTGLSLVSSTPTQHSNYVKKDRTVY